MPHLHLRNHSISLPGDIQSICVGLNIETQVQIYHYLSTISLYLRKLFSSAKPLAYRGQMCGRKGIALSHAGSNKPILSISLARLTPSLEAAQIPFLLWCILAGSQSLSLFSWHSVHSSIKAHASIQFSSHLLTCLLKCDFLRDKFNSSLYSLIYSLL